MQRKRQSSGLLVEVIGILFFLAGILIAGFAHGSEPGDFGESATTAKIVHLDIIALDGEPNLLIFADANGMTLGIAEETCVAIPACAHMVIRLIKEKKSHAYNLVTTEPDTQS